MVFQLQSSPEPIYPDSDGQPIANRELGQSATRRSV